MAPAAQIYATRQTAIKLGVEKQSTEYITLRLYPKDCHLPAPHAPPRAGGLKAQSDAFKFLSFNPGTRPVHHPPNRASDYSAIPVPSIGETTRSL